VNVVVHQAALGDFVLIWPLLRALDEPTVLVADRPRAELAANR
jgi:ADP-heptose:LPS heptosyltransferase